MPSATITGKVEGLQPIIDRMKHLKEGVQNRALNRALTKIARKAAKIAKAAAPRRTRAKKGKQKLTNFGQLKKSIGFDVSMKRGAVVATIGPRKGFRIQIGTRLRGGKESKAGDPIFHDPAKIAHLVEFGHGGPRPAPAHPFMRPALDDILLEVRPIISQEVDVEIAKQAAKGGK